MSKGRNKINLCKDLEEKENFTSSKAIIDMVLKNITSLIIEPLSPASEASNRQRKYLCFCVTYDVIVNNVKNKIIYYRETGDCRHPVFWPGN
jgi:hypothetical protein